MSNSISTAALALLLLILGLIFYIQFNFDHLTCYSYPLYLPFELAALASFKVRRSAAALAYLMEVHVSAAAHCLRLQFSCTAH